MHIPPAELAARLEVLAPNILALAVHVNQVAAVVADTKRQLDALRPVAFSPGKSEDAAGG
jgi:hypothetical protein